MVVGKRKNDVIQIGMTGKNIRFSKAHSKLACIGMELGAGLFIWKKAFENFTIIMRAAEGIKDFPVFVQNLDGQVDAMIKGFQ